MCYNVDHAWPYLTDFLKTFWRRFQSSKPTKTITTGVIPQMIWSSRTFPQTPNPQTAKNCQSQSCRRENGSTPLEGSFGRFFFWNIMDCTDFSVWFIDPLQIGCQYNRRKKYHVLTLIWYCCLFPRQSWQNQDWKFCPTITRDRSAFQKAVSQSIVKIWFEALLI